MKLPLDDDELAGCVSCGLCLPHCPTFRVTGEEAMSPRGRISAMRAVQWEGLEPGDDFIRSMESCVQCRGCETACPSGVHFGNLMEGTREELASRNRITPWWQRLAYRALPRHRLLLVGSTLLAVAQRLHLVPKRLGLPSLELRRPPAVVSTGTDVWLFTGCVMDAWQRETHRSTAAVLAAIGVRIQVPQRGGGCCGALHTHAGLTAESRSLAESVMSSMPGTAPIVVNSAGCGAAMKDYGHLLGTPAAIAFSGRVVDAQEFVAGSVERLAPLRSMGAVIVQDPCHLRHVQRVQQHTRTVLAAVAELVELDDEGLCCGAGGAYSALQPELANEIRDRKLASVARAQQRSGATVVASANPGCAMHLAAAGLVVRHPMDIVAEALR
jgi:glycolate oxidase iron-sulfur subunit